MVLVHRRLVLVHCHQYSVAAQGWIHQHLCERQRPRRPVFDTVRDMHADGTRFFFNSPFVSQRIPASRSRQIHDLYFYIIHRAMHTQLM